MTQETAQVVLAVIALVGLVVWLAALQFLILTSRVYKSRVDSAVDQLGLSEQLPENWYVGSAEVDGVPAALIDKAVAILVQLGSFQPGSFGPLKIVEKSMNGVAFERVGPMRAAAPAGGFYSRGRLMFSPLGSQRTRIDYAVELARGPWLLRLGWIFQAIGLVVLLGGASLLFLFCVPSPDPAVRTQVVQMVQAVHFLWPPFLCGGLYRQRLHVVVSNFDAFVHNLPYLQ